LETINIDYFSPVPKEKTNEVKKAINNVKNSNARNTPQSKKAEQGLQQVLAMEEKNKILIKALEANEKKRIMLEKERDKALEAANARYRDEKHWSDQYTEDSEAAQRKFDRWEKNKEALINEREALKQELAQFKSAATKVEVLEQQLLAINTESQQKITQLQLSHEKEIATLKKTAASANNQDQNEANNQLALVQAQLSSTNHDLQLTKIQLQGEQERIELERLQIQKQEKIMLNLQLKNATLESERKRIAHELRLKKEANKRKSIEWINRETQFMQAQTSLQRRMEAESYAAQQFLFNQGNGLMSEIVKQKDTQIQLLITQQEQDNNHNRQQLVVYNQQLQSNFEEQTVNLVQHLEGQYEVRAANFAQQVFTHMEAEKADFAVKTRARYQQEMDIQWNQRYADLMNQMNQQANLFVERVRKTYNEEVTKLQIQRDAVEGKWKTINDAKSLHEAAKQRHLLNGHTSAANLENQAILRIEGQQKPFKDQLVKIDRDIRAQESQAKYQLEQDQNRFIQNWAKENADPYNRGKMELVDQEILGQELKKIVYDVKKLFGESRSVENMITLIKKTKMKYHPDFAIFLGVSYQYPNVDSIQDMVRDVENIGDDEWVKLRIPVFKE
jgi:hypothetical protein